MNDALLLEKVETLDGSRGRGALPKAAVRVEDLTGVLQLPPRLRSAPAAGDPPTKAEYDALVADVRDIHRHLMLVSQALGARVRG